MPKLSVLQAKVNLVQKGECWNLNQRLIRGSGSILNRGNILLLDFFCFLVVKLLMLIISLLSVWSSLCKTLLNAIANETLPISGYNDLFTIHEKVYKFCSHISIGLPIESMHTDNKVRNKNAFQ